MNLKSWDIVWLVLMSMIIVDLALDMELQAMSQVAVFVAAIQTLRRKPNEQS